MKIAKGENVCIRKLEREDVDKMQHWGTHEDPLFFHYNFPKMKKNERDQWYRIKTMRFKRKSFAIENWEEKVIGYLSIRDIKWIKRESEMGIVLDPNYVGKGYGTEAIGLFLNDYFKELKMESINLRTAAFNKRAMDCYLHCGFKIIGEADDEFEDQDAEIFKNPLYKDISTLFKIIDGKKMTKYIYMKAKKEEYLNRSKTERIYTLQINNNKG